MIPRHRSVVVLRIREFLRRVFPRICCRSLPRFRSLFCNARVRRVRYPLCCFCSLLPASSPLFSFFVIGVVSVVLVRCIVIVSVVWLARFWSRRFFVRAFSRSSLPCVFLRFFIRCFVFERCVRISYRAVRKITLVYARCCVRSFVLVCPCVTARSGVSSFVCFHFMSVFTCGTFLYRCIVSSWSSFVRSVPRHSSRLFCVFRYRFRIVVLSVLRCRVLYG